MDRFEPPKVKAGAGVEGTLFADIVEESSMAFDDWAVCKFEAPKPKLEVKPGVGAGFVSAKPNFKGVLGGLTAELGSFMLNENPVDDESAGVVELPDPNWKAGVEEGAAEDGAGVVEPN